MKKKGNVNSISERCIIMNISSNIDEKGDNAIASKSVRNLKLPLKKSLNIISTLPSSPSVGSSDDENKNLDRKPLIDDGTGNLSPPLSSLGPGAEIKGKIGHPIPCSTQIEDLDSLEDSKSSANAGGRLTFFKEGKPLLELSHRNDQGSWVQVKSKTYWPPPSSLATTTAIQHPLRHDTPMTHSDDGSSIASSPCSGDHVRKKITPTHVKFGHLMDMSFSLYRSPPVLHLRRNVKIKKNPFRQILSDDKTLERFNNVDPSIIPKTVKRENFCLSDLDKKQKLELAVSKLYSKCFLKIDTSLSIYSLFEKVDFPACNDNSNPSFITPRKRYLRTLEADLDSQSKKKVHSSLSFSSQVKNCDKQYMQPVSTLSSSLPYPSFNKSAIGSPRSSPYSIDSLLSNPDNDTNRKINESFIKASLKSEKHHHALQKPSQSTKSYRGENMASESASHRKDLLRNNMYHHKDRKEINGDQRNDPNSLKRLDTAQDLNLYATHPNFNPLAYMNPYLDPRYMMLPQFATSSLFQGGNQPNDMASAVAMAAASYPMNHLQLSALTTNGLLPPAFPPVSNNSSLQSSHLRSPTPNRASPHLPIPHSPSPKVMPPSPFTLSRSPHVGVPGSPRDMWTPTSMQNSPQKHQTPSPVVSPPPQDAPLNLSKPKRK